MSYSMGQGPCITPIVLFAVVVAIGATFYSCEVFTHASEVADCDLEMRYVVLSVELEVCVVSS
jgi:hypothetical protein